MRLTHLIHSFRAADDIAAHPPSEKVERWEVLKNTTVARCAARVYCSVALALLLRVQLSVLAGQGRGRFNQSCMLRGVTTFP